MKREMVFKFQSILPLLLFVPEKGSLIENKREDPAAGIKRKRNRP
jgi:hypothetical protein